MKLFPFFYYVCLWYFTSGFTERCFAIASDWSHCISPSDKAKFFLLSSYYFNCFFLFRISLDFPLFHYIIDPMGFVFKTTIIWCLVLLSLAKRTAQLNCSEVQDTDFVVVLSCSFFPFSPLFSFFKIIIMPTYFHFHKGLHDNMPLECQLNLLPGLLHPLIP